jgi:hypothetical protein
MQFLEISWDFGILGFSKILGFFQRFFGIFDEVYEDFQSNLPLGLYFVYACCDLWTTLYINQIAILTNTV